MAADNNATFVVPLIISLIALVTSLTQLSISLFGTAQEYRLANWQIIGPFALTRKRHLRFTELRWETRFRAPHIQFFEANSDVEARETQRAFQNQDENLDDENEGETDVDLHIIKAKANDDVSKWDASYPEQDLEDWILEDGKAKVSRLERFKQIFVPLKSNSKRKRHALRASWLKFMSRVYYHETIFQSKTEKGKGRDWKYSLVPLGDIAQKQHQIMRRPAVRSVKWTWDLLPRDVVRPLASISLGDLLVYCFRLRIVVTRLEPAQRQFEADGHGHNFSPLNVQGVGLVLQYRSDQTKKLGPSECPANPTFIPSMATDKMAFGLIPEYPYLGIDHHWDIGDDDYLDSITSLFKGLGVSEHARDILRRERDLNKNDLLKVAADAPRLLSPFMPVDTGNEGLGIVKYRPATRHKHDCMLEWIEGRLIPYVSLQNLHPEPVSEVSLLPPSRHKYNSQTLWVRDIFDFFVREYRSEFLRGLNFRGIFGQNAWESNAKRCLLALRKALHEADEFLHDLHRDWEDFHYVDLVGAHLEMALMAHQKIAEERSKFGDKKAKEEPYSKYRPQPGEYKTQPPVLDKFKVELAYRYVDERTQIVDRMLALCAEREESRKRRKADKPRLNDIGEQLQEMSKQMQDIQDVVEPLSPHHGPSWTLDRAAMRVGGHIVTRKGLTAAKSKYMPANVVGSEKGDISKSAKWTEAEKRDKLDAAWWTMMLRGVLWELAHNPIGGWNFFPSRYWNNNTQVYIV